MKAVTTKQELPHGIDSPAIPPEYKQTDLGVIPEHWHIKQLVDICMPQGIVRGPFGGTLKKDIFVSSGFKVYEQRNAIYKSSEIGSYFVDQSKYAEMHRFSVSPGDFIISCSGTIGQIFQIPPDAPQGVINQALLKLMTDDKVVYDRYFYILFEWDEFQIRIIDSTQGGAIKNLVGMDIFRTITVALPPLEEQHAIAEALSDVDGLLNALEALIAKKRTIKQATMQQLLTGKTRLPGFSGKWETKRLGDLGNCLRGVSYDPTTDLSSYDKDSTVRLFRANNIQDAVVTLDDVQYVEARKVSEFQVMQPDDILVCMANGSKELVGKAGLFRVRDGHTYTFGAFMGCFRVDPTITEPSFVFYLFQTHGFRNFITLILAGSSINNLKPSDIESAEFKVPDRNEQTAIVSVLSDMDAEIAALEQRRDKTRAIKQGMMQQLLTGKVRLSESRIIADDTDDAD